MKRSTPEPGILEIREQDGDVLHLCVWTSAGAVTVLANFELGSDVLLLTQVHVEGEGLNRTIIKQAARKLGQLMKAATVVIQGGRRSSGAKPGTIPSTILVRLL